MRLETQMTRIVTDIESEKETRARTSIAFDRKLDEATESRNKRFDIIEERMHKQDRIIWLAVGIATAIQFAAQFLHK